MLYSCSLKLPNWIPEIVVNFLMKSAAVEVDGASVSDLHSLNSSTYLQATTWVKTVSEKAARSGAVGSAYPSFIKPVDLTPCFIETSDGGAIYDTKCSTAASIATPDEVVEVAAEEVVAVVEPVETEEVAAESIVEEATPTAPEAVRSLEEEKQEEVKEEELKEEEAAAQVEVEKEEANEEL